MYLCCEPKGEREYTKFVRSVTTNSQQTTYSITGGVAGLTCGTNLAATVVSTGTANVVDGEVNRRI